MGNKLSARSRNSSCPRHITSTLPIIDILGLKIKSSCGLFLFSFVVYIPPSINFNDSEFFLNLFSVAEESHMNNVVVLCDFNVPDFLASLDNRATILLKKFSDFHKFSECNKFNRILDVLFSNLHCSVKQYSLIL